MNKAYSRTETNQAAYEPTSLHSDNPHTPTERIRVEKSPPTEMPVCGSASRSAGGAVRPFCIPNSASTATTHLELGSFCRQNLRKKSIGVAIDRWPTDRRQCLLTILLALTVGRHNVPAANSPFSFHSSASDESRLPLELENMHAKRRTFAATSLQRFCLLGDDQHTVSRCFQ